MFKPWLLAEHQQEFADTIANACLEQYRKLPPTGKPSINGGKHEWTILAGIALVRQIEEVTPNPPLAKSKPLYFSVDNHHIEISVVSIGTGLKCMPLSKLSSNGDLVQDSHAEVIARRSFNKYLLNEIENCVTSKPSIFEIVDNSMSKMKLKEWHSFHMYISQAPCGDASMTELEAVQSEESQNAYFKGLKRKESTGESVDDPLSQYTYRSKKRKTVSGAEEFNDVLIPSIRRGRVGYQEFGILRTKPGRVDSEPTLSMSCSDKLARWNVLGLQSALISMLVSPIYLDCVIVNEMFDLQALRRSLFERLSTLPPLALPYRLTRPHILHSSKQFQHSKRALEAKVESSQIITCNTAISWTPGMPKAEVLVNGRRQGAPKPKDGQHSLKSRASICKLSLFQRFASIWQILEKKDSSLILDTTWMYQDTKNKATLYSEAKHKLLENCFQEWVLSPSEINMFDLQGTPVKPNRCSASVAPHQCDSEIRSDMVEHEHSPVREGVGHTLETLMQPNIPAGKDFVANIELSLAPNRLPSTYTLVLIAGELIQDHVINFMKKEHIPAYLESSILSTVTTLYEKYRNDSREAVGSDESLFEMQNLKQSRLAFINSYEQHTLEYHNKSAQDTFAKAYYSLVHSPIPSIFDTILELEQNYALSIMQLIQARDKEIRSIKERHEREMEESYAGSQPTYLITQQVEELEVCQATWASDIHETQTTQKREYRDFIAQLYQEYQNRLALSSQEVSPSTLNGVSKATENVDGKEIVSAAINKMKSNKQASPEQDHQPTQSDTQEEQSTDTTTIPGSSSQRGSSTSLLRNSPDGNDADEDKGKKSSQNISIPDPNLQRMVKNIEEMGFLKEEAECALGMTNCNVQQAIMLLLEQPDKVKAALASAESTAQKPSPGKVNMKRMSANIPNRSSSQAQFGNDSPSGSPQRPNSRQRAVTNPGSLTDALNKNGRSWSPITFLQQQKHAMENTNVSSVRKLGGWLGKAMENLGLDDNGSPFPTSPGQMHTSQLVESFTITLGTTHARATHNLRLVVMDEATEIFCPDISDTGRELAYRAQNANNLYSNQLSAMVVLVDINEVPIEHSTNTDQSYHRGWTRYRNGRGSNQALFTRCHQSTEFHFPDFDSQLQEIEKDYIQNQRSVEEGDFFITRHSNLPLTQIVFHLVIDGDAIPRVELSSRHPILSGLRNILRLTTRYEIGSLSLPLLLLPNYFLEQPEQFLFSSLSGDKASQTWLYKRGELVMKCVKGFLIESSRLGKTGPLERCFNFLLPKSTQIFSTHSGVNELSADVRGGQSQPDLEVAFQQFRRMLVEMFRAT